MKYLPLLPLLLCISCVKPLDSLNGTWWITPANQVQHTTIHQLHWNRNGDLFIWRNINGKSVEFAGRSTVNNGQVMWQELKDGYLTKPVMVFEIVDSEYSEIIIDEGNGLFTLIRN